MMRSIQMMNRTIPHKAMKAMQAASVKVQVYQRHPMLLELYHQGMETRHGRSTSSTSRKRYFLSVHICNSTPRGICSGRFAAGPECCPHAAPPREK